MGNSAWDEGETFVDVGDADYSIDNDILTITPKENFNGDIDITVEVDDGELENSSHSITFTLTVTPDNDPPEATDGQVEVQVGETITIDLSDYADDVDSSDLDYSIDMTEVVTLGTLEWFNEDSDTGIVTYTAGDVTGEDSFNFYVVDDELETDSATITITIIETVTGR